MQKFNKYFLNFGKLLETSKNFITNFTECLDILRNLLNTDMKNISENISKL